MCLENKERLNRDSIPGYKVLLPVSAGFTGPFMSNPIYQVGTWYTRDDPFFGIHGFSSSNSAVAYLMHVRNEINAGAVLAECSFKGDLWLGDQKIFSECGFNITIPFCIEANEMKLVEILDLSSARFEYERTYVFESLRDASAALKAMSERLV